MKKRFSLTFKAISGLLIIGLATVYVIQMQVWARKLPIQQYFPNSDTTSVAIWDWANVLNHTSGDLKQTSDFLYLHQVNEVYLDVSQYADIAPNDTAKKQALETALVNYVHAMQANGIHVFAGAGNTDWSKPDQQHIPLSIQQLVYDFNDAHPDTKLAGIEFDIEAYNQDGFPTASDTEKTIVLTEMLDTVQTLVAKQNQLNSSYQTQLELGFTIPYWYDNENGNIPSITWQNKTGPMLYHIVDTLNQLPKANVDVMAYRNAAGGNDGSIFHSRTEVEYATAKAPHVKVLVGQELNDVQPAKITFYGMSIDEFSGEVRVINDAYKSDSGYGGIAINDLKGLQRMDQAKSNDLLH